MRKFKKSRTRARRAAAAAAAVCRGSHSRAAAVAVVCRGSRSRAAPGSEAAFFLWWPAAPHSCVEPNLIKMK